MTKQLCLIFDLDGTFFNVKHREHHVAGSDYKEADFHKFYEAMDNDIPHPWALRMLQLYFAADYKIFFVTGRPANYRDRTMTSLEKHTLLKPYQYELYMRDADDYDTKDTVLKEKHYRDSIEPRYEVDFVVEDRNRVVDHWRKIGLVCLQCYPGDF
jgi:acid phosphatase class B